MYFAIAAIGLNVQFGYAGLLNFGQAGFMACGAYAVGMTTHYYHISFWWGIPIAIAYAVIFGLIMGIPTLRLRADYLAIVTIALAEVVRLLVRSVTFKKKFGGSDGINGFAETFRNVTPFDDAKRYKLYPFDASNGTGGHSAAAGALRRRSACLAGRMIVDRFGREGWNDRSRSGRAARCSASACCWSISTYVEYGGLSFKAIVVGWILAAVLGLFVYMLMRSPWGRVLKGIREDEEAVRSLGKSVYSYKMQALILGGVIATFSGIMFSLDRGSVQPDNYSRDVTFYVLTALVLGWRRQGLGFHRRPDAVLGHPVVRRRVPQRAVQGVGQPDRHLRLEVRQQLQPGRHDRAGHDRLDAGAADGVPTAGPVRQPQGDGPRWTMRAWTSRAVES